MTDPKHLNWDTPIECALCGWGGQAWALRPMCERKDCPLKEADGA